ncbi:hypothetical protein IJ531_00865, partial [bacterium]|nr:hypothetical protein [bacterium]
WKLEHEYLKNVPDRELQSYNFENRKPIIIVSSPLSVEGILISLFEKNFPAFRNPLLSEENIEYNKKIIKNSFSGLLEKMSDEQYYKKYLTKGRILKMSKTIPQLRLLLDMLDIKE